MRAPPALDSLRRAPLVVSAFFLVLILSGCDLSPAATGSKSPPEIGPVTNYPARGVVQSIPAGAKSVVIRHEAIKGYMDAMTMPFDVRDSAEISGVKPGDIVEFRLRVSETEGWIDQVRRVGFASNSPVAEAPRTPEIPVDGPLSPGDPVRNFTMTNELGRAFQLSDFRGRAVAVDFIFTRCPYPAFCPLLSRNFAAVQRGIVEGSGPLTNARLISISFDPANDTPAVLAAYGRGYHQSAPVWTLASGDMTAIANLAVGFGLFFSPNAAPAQQNHNLRTAVIDPEGRLVRLFIGNEWTPEDLVRSLDKAARGEKEP
jgi:protein SCO1